MGTSGQTPRQATLPISMRPISVVGNSTDANDGFVDVVGIYNYQIGSFNYLLGTNMGSYGLGLTYFIAVGF